MFESSLKVILISLFVFYPAVCPAYHWTSPLLHEPQQASSANAQKFKHAIVRSEDAAKIVELLNEMRDTGFPKELVERAEGVGVFPLVEKETVLFTQSIKGYGVISSRTPDGWSLPAFYRFAGGGYTGKFAGIDSMAVILLFMDKQAMSWFEKGGVHLGNERKAIAGPVETITDEQKKEVAGAHILSYVYSDSRLQGANFGTTFKNFLLNPDNNINKPIYGMKGRDVLAGKKVDPLTVPPGIPTFQEVLERYYPRH